MKKKKKKKEKRKLMVWIEVYGGQRSLAFELLPPLNLLAERGLFSKILRSRPPNTGETRLPLAGYIASPLSTGC